MLIPQLRAKSQMLHAATPKPFGEVQRVAEWVII